MKPLAPEIQIVVVKTEGKPTLSFSHLSSCFASEDSVNDNQIEPSGFPAPQEEDLYQTGYLFSVFLKC